MEALALLPVNQNLILPQEQILSSSKPFIEANTIESSLDEIRNKHIIPTYRNNERLISVAEFIETCATIVKDLYSEEIIFEPNIRMSHAVRGRIPDAKNKKVEELEEHETTLFFERTAFLIEVGSIQTNVGGNMLSLAVGGIKSYQNDNVNGKENSDEHFSFFIGYINKICSNGCFWGDGFSNVVKVKHLGELHALIHSLFSRYNASHHIHHLNRLNDLEITEKQFSQLVGKCRMYQHLPTAMKNSIPALLLSDTQINSVVKDYYRDESFCRQDNGKINLWKLYNLFTGATKSSYIDSFIERNVNAYHFIESIRFALENKTYSWFIN